MAIGMVLNVPVLLVLLLIPLYVVILDPKIVLARHLDPIGIRLHLNVYALHNTWIEEMAYVNIICGVVMLNVTMEKIV